MVNGVHAMGGKVIGAIVQLASGTQTLKWQCSLSLLQDCILDDVLVTINTNLTEDTDDDNDGVLDVNDEFPLNAAASVDDDNDGLPDQWNQLNPYGCAANALTCNGLRLDPDTVNQIVWPLNSPYKGSSIKENNTWQ